MPRLIPKVLTVSLAASLASATLCLPAAAQQAGARSAPQASARQSMEQCVAAVLTRLARSRAAEGQVGPAVVTQCDRQLRATLAEVIRTGQAGFCTTVESCIDMARARTAEEALQIYRQHFRR